MLGGTIKLHLNYVAIALGSVLLFRSLCVAGGQSTNELFSTGMQALEAKDFSRAVEAFSELARKEPSSANIGYLAVAESGAGKLSQAITDFQRAIQLGNDSVLTHYGLGSAYLRSNQPEAAARELRLALAKDTNSMPARYALGVALLDQGHAQEAIPYLEEARNHSPTSAQIWVSLIHAQFQSGNTKAAIQLADEATEAVPDNPQLQVAVARLCLQHQQLPKARTLLESAVELQPADADAKLLLANVCLHSGNPAEVMEILRNLPPGSDEPGEAIVLTAEARALTGDMALARTDLSVALDADPENTDFLRVSAWLDQMQSRFEPALATLTEVHAREGDKPDLLYQMGLSYYFLGDYSRAADACAGVLRLAPRYDRAYVLEGLSKLELKEMAAARAAIQHAVALNPDSALNHRELGMTLCRMGDLAASEAELDRALTLDPHAVQSYYWRAQVLDQKREPQKAIDDLETAVALEPQFTDAYAALAKLYSAQGQAQKAAAMLEAGKKLEKTNGADDQNRASLWRELSGPLP